MQEIEGLRTLTEYRNRGNYRGRRTFLTAQASAESGAASMWGQQWPGPASAICSMTNVIWHPSGVPAVAMIQAHYDTERFMVWEPGRATDPATRLPRGRVDDCVRLPVG